ncbi:MAG: methyltransferase [Pseudomonadota bacterium]
MNQPYATSIPGQPNRSFVKKLIDEAARPYRAAGRFAWHFARGKLGGDPVFVGMLAHGLLPPCARIVDIGCGQGLLAAWLKAAKTLQDRGYWPAGLPPAPDPISIHGIELMARDVARARAALGDANQMALRFTVGDMCDVDFGQADAVVILDVLHYVDVAAQNEVLRRVRDTLTPNGRLILRVGDANGGWPFRFSVWVDHAVTFARGHRHSQLHCRPLSAWQATLAELGFSVRTIPMNQGTPFANILLVGALQ